METERNIGIANETDTMSNICPFYRNTLCSVTEDIYPMHGGYDNEYMDCIRFQSLIFISKPLEVSG